MASGQPAKPFGLNAEGLKRRGFEKDAILNIKRAYKTVYRQGLSVEEALNELTPLIEHTPDVQMFADSVSKSTRGIIR